MRDVERGRASATGEAPSVPEGEAPMAPVELLEARAEADRAGANDAEAGGAEAGGVGAGSVPPELLDTRAKPSGRDGDVPHPNGHIMRLDEFDGDLPAASSMLLMLMSSAEIQQVSRNLGRLRACLLYTSPSPRDS